MIPRLATRLIMIGGLVVLPTSLRAQKQPQDNFWMERSWQQAVPITSGSYLGYGLAVDASQRIYVANGSQILVYDVTGTMLTNWAVAAVRDVVALPGTNLIVTCSANTATNQIKVFTDQGVLVRQWGNPGSGLNQLNTPFGIAVATNGTVYVADYGNNRIQVFDFDGNWLTGWGKSGTVGGEFRQPASVAVTLDGLVHVADHNNYRIQTFDAAGNFVRQYAGGSTQWRPNRIVISPDQEMYVSDTYGYRNFRVVTPDGQSFFSITPGLTRYSDGANVLVYAGAFTADGQQLYVLTDRDIRVLRRGYRTTGPLIPNAVPLPRVLRVAQRPGTSYVDVDYAVLDPDDATVTVAAAGFFAGRKDLGAFLPLTTFVEGTAVNIGTNIPTGQIHRLTWDVAAGGFTNTANIQVTILAKDGRGLMDSHFLTLPTNSTYGTTLTISRSPFVQDDFLQLWTWLLATGNTNIICQTGTVYGVTEPYTGRLLAQTTGTNTVTTSDGRSFLFALLGVREATTNEVTRAKEGTTPGTVTKWTPRVQVGSLPQAINSVGFDTGLFSTNVSQHVSNAWWVVPLP